MEYTQPLYWDTVYGKFTITNEDYVSGYNSLDQKEDIQINYKVHEYEPSTEKACW